MESIKIAILAPERNRPGAMDRALLKAAGVPRAAIDDLESGIALEGAAGSYRFDSRNHNGRSGGGPTLLSRWREGRVEEIV